MRSTIHVGLLLGALPLCGCGGGGGDGPTDPEGGAPAPTLATIRVDASADQRPISPDVTVSGGSFDLTLGGDSATMIVVP